MWSIPVAVDDVNFAITVEISQCYTTTVLVGVIQAYREEQVNQEMCVLNI